jgi:hypothetical protein
MRENRDVHQGAGDAGESMCRDSHETVVRPLAQRRADVKGRLQKSRSAWRMNPVSTSPGIRMFVYQNDEGVLLWSARC